MSEDLLNLSRVRETNLATPTSKDIEKTDPFSNDPEVRASWYSSLQIPEINYDPEKTKIIKTLGKGDSGKVYLAEIDGKPYAIKFVKKDWNPIESTRNEYAGFLLANNLEPNVFPKPKGILINRKGEVAGLVMEALEGKRLVEFFDLESFKKGEIAFKEGLSLPDSFFVTLERVISKLHQHNLWLTDWNGGKILVDKNDEPFIVDVQYYTRAMTKDDEEVDNEALETVKKANKKGEI